MNTNKTYDLVIVGAGPGGLMAAKTAGEKGLAVALLLSFQVQYVVQKSSLIYLTILSNPRYKLKAILRRLIKELRL